MTNQAIVKQVEAALEYEPRINVHRHPIKVGLTDGSLMLEGDVEDIAAKKLALELAAAVDGVRMVVDRLHVAPAERKGDGAIRDSLCDFLLREAELRNCTLRIRRKGIIETLRNVLDEASGQIVVEV